MQVTITAIKRTDRVGKLSGKAFVGVGLKCDKYGEQWLSGFGGPENADWKAGDTVEIEVETKGKYLNFKTPKTGARSVYNAPGAMKEGDVARIMNAIESKVMAALSAIYERQALIGKALDIKMDDEKFEYPKHEATAFDEPVIQIDEKEITIDDVPF